YHRSAALVAAAIRPNMTQVSPVAEPRPERSKRSAPRVAAARRRLVDRLFLGVCVVTASTTVLLLFTLLAAIAVQGWRYLEWGFITSGPHPNVEKAGVYPALMGTIWICTLCALLALPIGVATAVWLEEFRPRNRWLVGLHSIVQLNITNLAGVPSVVYGILGLTAFVSMFNLFGTVRDPLWEIGARYYDQFVTEGERVVLIPVAGRNAPITEVRQGIEAQTTRGEKVELNVIGPSDPLPSDAELRARTIRSDAEGGRISYQSWYYMQIPFGRGVLAGALTLMLVILPIVIISTQEAIRAVPDSLREGALGLGATRWQTVWNVSLPAAIPGIMTGSILSTSRAIGEAAPILIIAGILYISSAPRHLA